MNARILPLIGFLLIAALLAFGIHWNTRHELNEVPSPLINKPAPDYKLPLLYDPSKTLSKQEMLGKPYLVNVFGSWCPTCQDEHPFLMSQGKTFGIQIVGLDWKDDADNAKRWLARFGDPYHVVITDPEGGTGINFGVYGAPETFLIDAKGIIRYKRIGMLTPQVIEDELKPNIVRVLKEK